jgi:tRNA pseudouridine32 synthase/23S rRNA pseudouridine746 synthase/23S rRNA pseudouridine1911/1915/1917 synthase
VLLEDEAVLVLDKPPGISVTGERHDIDVVRLAADAGEVLLPAHRIDKVTSGVVLFARSAEVHGGLTRQFNRRTVGKDYLVVARGTGLPARGTIDLPLGEGRKGRVRVAAPREAIARDPDTDRWSVPDRAVRADRRTYPSVTTFVRLGERAGHTALLVRPHTGRRHQIRVHLAWIGHAIAGDPLFERDPAVRTCLHAWRLAFDASWSDGRRIVVEAVPGADLWVPLGASGTDPDALVATAVRASGGRGGEPVAGPL